MWVVLTLALVIGNFLYQALRDQDWEAAFERSFFQTLAIIFIYFMKPWE